MGFGVKPHYPFIFKISTRPELYALIAPSIRYHMKIILPDKTTRETGSDPVSVEALVRNLGFEPIEVIVARNGTLVAEDAVVSGDDEVRIIRIAHGG